MAMSASGYNYDLAADQAYQRQQLGKPSVGQSARTPMNIDPSFQLSASRNQNDLAIAQMQAETQRHIAGLQQQTAMAPLEFQKQKFGSLMGLLGGMGFPTGGGYSGGGYSAPAAPMGGGSPMGAFAQPRQITLTPGDPTGGMGSAGPGTTQARGPASMGPAMGSNPWTMQRMPSQPQTKAPPTLASLLSGMPQVNTGPVYSKDNIQQQVNASRARGDQKTAGENVRLQQQLASRGYGAGSGLGAELATRGAMANRAMQTGEERNLRTTAAQQNADFSQRGQSTMADLYQRLVASQGQQQSDYDRTQASLYGNLLGYQGGLQNSILQMLGSLG